MSQKVFVLHNLTKIYFEIGQYLDQSKCKSLKHLLIGSVDTLQKVIDQQINQSCIKFD